MRSNFFRLTFNILLSLLFNGNSFAICLTLRSTLRFSSQFILAPNKNFFFFNIRKLRFSDHHASPDRRQLMAVTRRREHFKWKSLMSGRFFLLVGKCERKVENSLSSFPLLALRKFFQPVACSPIVDASLTWMSHSMIRWHVNLAIKSLSRLTMIRLGAKCLCN